MEYKVVITSDAEEDLDGFIRFLLFEKQSEQADAEHEELQHRVETLEAIDNGKYYHGGMYARDNEDMKFIIFGKTNK